MVEREAVRLGVQYQIAGKFTSFVATETDPENPKNTVSRKIGLIEPQESYAQTSQPRWKSIPIGSGGGAFSKPLGGLSPVVTVDESRFIPYCSELSDSSALNASAHEDDGKVEETDPMQKIIALQTFEGYWNLDATLLEIVGLSAQHKAPKGVVSKVWAAMLAITFLEGKLVGDKEAWEMVVEKARGWLKDMEKGQEKVFEEKWRLAEQLVMGAE